MKNLFTGEVEITARTAGLSSIIVLATIVPLLLLIIIILYRYVKQKNVEIARKEQQNYFAEMERHRWQLYQKMQADHLKRENEIEKYLRDEQEKPSTSKAGNINNRGPLNLIDVANNVDSGGDSTDDEFFERPLPPLPVNVIAKSPTVSDQTSIIDNEAIVAKTPKMTMTSVENVEETPKVGNDGHFVYPPKENRAPPPPPLHIPIEISSNSPSLLIRSKTPENETPVIMNPQRDSTHPIIIDVTPKSLLESEL